MVCHEQNQHFTGRDELLTQLREKLLSKTPKQYNHRVAIYGMGGVGKTQIAIEYVYRFRQSYDNIFWINASDQASLLTGFQEIGTLTHTLPTTSEASPIQTAKAVLTWLRGQESWLLIVDNLDDISVAKGYLPEIHEGGHTLITTRNPNAIKIPAEGVEIPVLEEAAAIELLRIRSKNDHGYSAAERLQAAELVKELGYLALAIEQVSGFLRSSIYSIEEFQQLYSQSRTRILKQKPDGNTAYPNSVATAFLLSVQEVKKMEYGAQALKLLYLFVLLSPDGILVDFLQAGLQGLSDEIRIILEDQLCLHDALESLQAYSLIRRSKQTIIIHRLIRAVVKDNMVDSELQMYRDEIIRMCNAAFPKRYYDTKEARDLCRSFQNQVIEPVFEASQVQSNLASLLLDRIADFLRKDGKYVDSARLNVLSLKIDRVLFGDEHPDTLTSMGNLALTYRKQGKLSEAAELEGTALKARKRTLGEEHPDTLRSMSNLASTYWEQGKLSEAAELEEVVLEARKRTLGEEHPDTLTSMGNLASTYRKQGKLSEAAELEGTALKARKRTLGEEHPDTLMSMGNLALMYWKQGKLSEAAELEGTVLEASKRTFGDRHIDEHGHSGVYFQRSNKNI